MTYVDIAFAGRTFRGRLLERRAPRTTAAIKALLPLEGRMIQDEWSAAVARMIEPLAIGDAPDRIAGFEYPGLLALDVIVIYAVAVHGREAKVLRTA